jgi:Tfp pilus assembly major pilin PilA
MKQKGDTLINFLIFLVMVSLVAIIVIKVVSKGETKVDIYEQLERSKQKLLMAKKKKAESSVPVQNKDKIIDSLENIINEYDNLDENKDDYDDVDY